MVGRYDAHELTTQSYRLCG